MIPAIEVTRLSKQFRLGPGTVRADSLREFVTQGALRLLGRRRKETGTRSIWALKNVTLAISSSEVVGIIGSNGAGKSTLLKILSRITSPTTGEVRIKGRVTSLLEVGTGFHPELTGRENIFLNGAILGMSRQDIRSRFDSIVSFAEIERFIDTPVKRYSSGMYTRLAFAVASHMEADVLLLDEVLAVGDARFQERCFGRMNDIARSGRTILLVSHNMEAVRRLSTRSVLLSNGEVIAIGTTDGVVGQYLGRLEAEASGADGEFLAPDGTRIRAEVNGRRAGRRQAWLSGELLVLEIEVVSKREETERVIDITLYSRGGTRLFGVTSDGAGTAAAPASSVWRYVMTVEGVRLGPGMYYADLGIRRRSDRSYGAVWNHFANLEVISRSEEAPVADGSLLAPLVTVRREK